ncbi:MAG: dTDP-glucose 4,6-dehydratase [Rhodospirillaceae bacterium]|nr:dTDP-glucose 4,6-dehydratase [Rhodospirillaceae bacterium]
MKKTILITGGAGFIGSNMLHYLSSHYPDYRFIVLDALTYAGSTDNLPKEALESEHPRFKFWYGNVCNAELVDSLVAESDTIIHFAAETHVTRSIYDNLQFFQTDVMGTHTIANAVLKSSKKVKRLIHISTSEVYGTAMSEKMDEKHPLNPMSPYASAKCGADRLVYSYWATYKIPAVIIRPFNNFGPRQHLEKVVPRFITGAILGEPMVVHGDGEAARDFVFVDDVCRAIDLVLHAPDDKVCGEVFNIASGNHRSVKSIAQDISRLMNYDESNITFTYDRPGQVVRHTGDYEKAKRVLGWEPQNTWETGLEKTIKWYTENRPQWEKQLWMRHIPITTSNGKVDYH